MINELFSYGIKIYARSAIYAEGNLPSTLLKGRFGSD
ncbi:hypothetical protein SAMN05444412_110114 [Rhodonellum ikkaensis]|uniref:Uncharacterized protein n=1 Tax=Rhodonellum ikkaensis TaxID=336829 RepID=A0A1H3S547_9BACT|nr:hypothetical protein SAMN05444412_110114 [Rhodonellum ikkaensis]